MGRHDGPRTLGPTGSELRSTLQYIVLVTLHCPMSGGNAGSCPTIDYDLQSIFSSFSQYQDPDLPALPAVMIGTSTEGTNAQHMVPSTQAKVLNYKKVTSQNVTAYVIDAF